MSQKPTLVFVHGAWHTPKCWEKVIALLEPQGYKCIAPRLPSTTGDKEIGVKEDIDIIRDSIVSSTTQGQNVVLIAHSYGGIVASSVIKGLSKPKDGNPSDDKSAGYVIGLILIATGFAATGISFLDLVGGKPPPTWILDPSGFAEVVVDARELFYHDLPEEEGKYWVSELVPQSSKALTHGGEYIYSGWEDVPIWYLVTLEDRAFGEKAGEIQNYAVGLARDGGGDVTVREVGSSHSPMLSMPEETAGVIRDAAKAFGGQRA